MVNIISSLLIRLQELGKAIYLSCNVSAMFVLCLYAYVVNDVTLWHQSQRHHIILELLLFSSYWLILLVWVCFSLYCFLVFAPEIFHPTSLASRLVLLFFSLPDPDILTRFVLFSHFSPPPTSPQYVVPQATALSWHIELFVFPLTSVDAHFSSFALLFCFLPWVKWVWLFARNSKILPKASLWLRL